MLSGLNKPQRRATLIAAWCLTLLPDTSQECRLIYHLIETRN